MIYWKTWSYLALYCIPGYVCWRNHEFWISSFCLLLYFLLRGEINPHSILSFQLPIVAKLVYQFLKLFIWSICCLFPDTFFEKPNNVFEYIPCGSVYQMYFCMYNVRARLTSLWDYRLSCIWKKKEICYFVNSGYWMPTRVCMFREKVYIS